MPSLRLLGSGFHLSSDMMPLLGAALFIPSAVLLVCYSVFLATFRAAPAPSCTDRDVDIRESVLWGLLALGVFNVAAALAMVVVGMQGTPFESSKRWLMAPLLYVQGAKWLLGIGFSTYSFWAVYTIPHGCWSNALRRLVKGMLWGSLSVYSLLIVFFYFASNALAEYDAQKRWQIRLKKASHLLGCYSTLTQAGPGAESSGETPLEELSGWFLRYFGGIDLEKSDVVVGLALAQIMQVHQRKTLIAERLHQSGALAKSRMPPPPPRWRRRRRPPEQSPGPQQQPTGSPDDVEDGPEEAHRIELAAAAAEGVADGAQAGEPVGPEADEEAAAEQPQEVGQAGGTAAEAVGQGEVGDHVALEVSDVDAMFEQWIQAIAGPPQQCLTPSHWGAQLAPQLTPRVAAEMYTGCREYVDLPSLLQVQRFAKYAIAAYGVPLTSARRLPPAARVVATAQQPVRQKLEQNPAYVKAYVAAQQIAGISDDEFIYLDFTNGVCGATPYLIALNRATRTVVLAVRGSNSMEDLLTDMMDRPVRLDDWLPAGFLQEHPECLSGVSAHMGMYSAAKAVLQDLNRHQILPILLTGAPLADEEQERQRVWHAPDDRQRRWQAERLARHSLDSRIDRKAARQAAKAGGRPGAGGQVPRRQRHGQWSRQLGGWSSSHEDWQLPGEAGLMESAYSLPARISISRAANGSARGGRRRSMDVARPLGRSGSAAAADQEAAAQDDAAAAAAGVHKRGSGSSGASKQSAAAEEQLLPADFQRLLRERGVDCRGWSLVVTGHSLGAAVAALIGLHLRDWCPGIRVTAFNPPGGMATLNLAHAMQGFVTSVVVGKDAISRIGTMSFGKLLDQMVLCLARCKLSKARVLLGMRSARLRERPPADIFRPIDEIPAEALAVVRQYFESKLKFIGKFVDMFPPGKILLLRRLKEDDAALKARGGVQPGLAPGGGRRQRPSKPPAAPPAFCCPTCGGTLLMWDAVWAQPEQVIEEGILLSSTQASDHFTSTLTFVLDQLTGHETVRAQATLPPSG